MSRINQAKSTNHQYLPGDISASTCHFEFEDCHGGGLLTDTDSFEVLGFLGSTAAPVRVSRKATISANSAAVSEAAKDGML